MAATATNTASRPHDSPGASAATAASSAQSSGQLPGAPESPAQRKPRAPGVPKGVAARAAVDDKPKAPSQSAEATSADEVHRPGAPAPEKSVPPEVPPPPVPAKPSAAETRAVLRSVRRERTIRMMVRVALFVVMPTALSAVYYLAIASDQFESHTAFTIHAAEARMSLGLESLMGVVGGGSASQDTISVREYILSRDVLARLDKEQRFVEHYKSGKLDWLSRLSHDASFEDAYQYYESKVSAEFQTSSGSVQLRVRAFSAEAAKRFAATILKYGEEKVNMLSDRERRDRIGFAASEVEQMEARLAAARQALLKLQQEHGQLNPLQTAQSAYSIKSGLEAELAKTQAQLSARRAYLSPEAPEVIELREMARALSGQIASENRKLVDPKRKGGVAESFAAFESASMEKEFAEKAYGAAIAALELARSDAVRQHRYLIVLAEPSLADESTYPNRGLSIAGVFALSFLAMGILSLLIAAVREHSSI